MADRLLFYPLYRQFEDVFDPKEITDRNENLLTCLHLEKRRFPHRADFNFKKRPFSTYPTLQGVLRTNVLDSRVFSRDEPPSVGRLPTTNENQDINDNENRILRTSNFETTCFSNETKPTCIRRVWCNTVKSASFGQVMIFWRDFASMKISSCENRFRGSFPSSHFLFALRTILGLKQSSVLEMNLFVCTDFIFCENLYSKNFTVNGIFFLFPENKISRC